ncbi:MAG: nitrate oxidoreductase subunit beta, partial [Dehalococcoidia bacterium]|nr:nitrate oxidoreductase subunit beta [Dehalococcoidia bacterium]
ASQRIVFSYKIEPGPKTAEITVGGQKREIFNDTIIGYDSNGKEVVRVTVDEPTAERPGQLNSI